MRITDLLQAERIILELKARDKDSVLKELAQEAANHCDVSDAGKILETVLAREKLASTAIGEGVAIPHGKMSGVARSLAVLGRSSSGIDFQSPDGQATHLFFFLIAPEDAASDHLEALARISRLLKKAEFRKRIIAGRTEQEIFTIIEGEDSKP